MAFAGTVHTGQSLPETEKHFVQLLHKMNPAMSYNLEDERCIRHDDEFVGKPVLDNSLYAQSDGHGFGKRKGVLGMTLTPPFSRKGVAHRSAHRLLELKPDGIRLKII